MTPEEIILVKELIKETVKSVVESTVKQAIRSEIESIGTKKDLKEIKLLVAKSIKESKNLQESLLENLSKDHTNPASINENFGINLTNIKKSVSNRPLPPISSEQAMRMSVDGTLPDFDAPIPFIDKKSAIWEDLNKKIS